MWCRHCQQDVPGIITGGEEAYSCPRCSETLADPTIPAFRVDAAHASLSPSVTARSSRLVLSRLAPVFDPWEVDETLRSAAVVLGIEGTENTDLSSDLSQPSFQATSGTVEEPQTIAVAATPRQPVFQSTVAAVEENQVTEVPEVRLQSMREVAFKHVEIAETIEMPVILPGPVPECTPPSARKNEQPPGFETPVRGLTPQATAIAFQEGDGPRDNSGQSPGNASVAAGKQSLSCDNPPDYMTPEEGTESKAAAVVQLLHGSELRKEDCNGPHVATTPQLADRSERELDARDEIYPARQTDGLIAAVERFQSRMILPALAWITTFLGTMALVCGGALLVWSQVVHRPELWPIGQPIALGGAFVLVLGLALQWDRSS